MGDYVAALRSEFTSYPELAAATLYLGGGTPSILPPDLLEGVLEGASEHFDLAGDAEITMEINPGTGSADLWRVARQGGVNRVSVGAQAFDASMLARLGRDHGVEDITRTVTDLREAGFDDLSLDLMFGLPGQDLDRWRHTLDRAIALDPEHFSVYGLQVEERTAFGIWHARGELPLPGEDSEREMLDVLVETLAQAGYRRYEISSWSRPGFESAHNRIYWQGRPYLGFGTGAHSYYHDRRYEHGRSITGYIRSPLPELPDQPQSRREAMEEAVFMGLRLVHEGMSRAEFRARFDTDVEQVFGREISRLADLGMLEVEPDSLRLTEAALPVANAVLAEFVS